jgi:hypothetical protein
MSTNSVRMEQDDSRHWSTTKGRHWNKDEALDRSRSHHHHVGMAVRIWVLGHLWVLDPTGVSSDLFLHPRVEPALDSHRTKFWCGFHFSAETKKNWKTPNHQRSSIRVVAEVRIIPCSTCWLCDELVSDAALLKKLPRLQWQILNFWEFWKSSPDKSFRHWHHHVELE